MTSIFWEINVIKHTLDGNVNRKMKLQELATQKLFAKNLSDVKRNKYPSLKVSFFTFRTNSPSDAFESVEYPPKPPKILDIDAPTKQTCRRNPFTEAEFQKLFDKDGRLVDEHKLRQEIFRGKFFNIFNIVDADAQTLSVAFMN